MLEAKSTRMHPLLSAVKKALSGKKLKFEHAARSSEAVEALLIYRQAWRGHDKHAAVVVNLLNDGLHGFFDISTHKVPYRARTKSVRFDRLQSEPKRGWTLAKDRKHKYGKAAAKAVPIILKMVDGVDSKL